MAFATRVGVPTRSSGILIELFFFITILGFVAVLPLALTLDFEHLSGFQGDDPNPEPGGLLEARQKVVDKARFMREVGERTHLDFAALWLSSSDDSAGSSKVWTISEISGRANIVKSGAAPVSLTRGAELRPGDMIETAADSGAILERNGESIIVEPNSRMGLPAANDSEFATQILQQRGTLLLNVEKRSRRHFEVKTPYLVAIVKGTTFSVTVNSQGASVHVLEGAVHVADKTGMAALVRPGQTAIVSSRPGSGLSIQGAPASANVQDGSDAWVPGHGARNETGAGSGALDVSWTSRPLASYAAASFP